MLADVVNKERHIAISYYPADELLFSFLLLTSTSVILFGCGSRLTVFQISIHQKAADVMRNQCQTNNNFKWLKKNQNWLK
jgi:hypothetical protein